MTQNAGQMTGQFGWWLTEYLRKEHADKHYIVYYDHGDPAKHDNVAAIKGFIGGEVKNENRLADVDVMVADEDHNIRVLIEIEESPLSPKTLLGDVFASLVSTGFSILDDGQRYFKVSRRTRLIVAGFHPNLERRKNYRDDIRRRIGQFSVPVDAISIDNVEFIIESDLDSCLRKLRQRIKKIL